MGHLPGPGIYQTLRFQDLPEPGRGAPGHTGVSRRCEGERKANQSTRALWLGGPPLGSLAFLANANSLMLLWRRQHWRRSPRQWREAWRESVLWKEE